MPLKNYSDTKTTIWQKLQAITFSLVVGALIYWFIMWYIDYNFEHNKEEILSNPIYVYGTISAKRTYKGKGVNVVYFVNDKEFILRTGITTEFYNKYSVGDSVEIVYSKKDPSKAILKYELKSAN